MTTKIPVELSSTPGIVDGSNATAITIDSSENVTVNTGNLVIGTSGKGIDFSATADAGGMTSELLDDYEEGTFTPVYTATGLSVTHDIQNGLYTKVGDTVNFWILLGTDAKSGSSSSYILTITGLPYACKNTASSFASGSVGLAYTWASNEQSMKWFIGANTSIISLYAGDSNAGGYITPADMGTTSNDNRLYISGCYKTD